MKEYILNKLDVDHYHIDTVSSKRFLYKNIRSNLLLDGDIFEFGVYRGATLLALGLLLKELGSDKKIYGFDSFSGFPSYSREDGFEMFRNNPDVFDDKFICELDSFLEFQKQFNNSEKLNEINLAESLDFSNNDLNYLKKKISYLKLDNIILFEGDFQYTIPNFFNSFKGNILACNIDCDLYEGYNLILPYVYERLVNKGYIHLDEYYSFKYPGAKIAVDNFVKNSDKILSKQKSRGAEFPRFYITK